MIDFKPFPKIPRMNRNCVVTEKLDGTNAGIQIVQQDEQTGDGPWAALLGGFAIYAQSRSRFVTPAEDNYGFAAWVADNAPALAGLGEGCHFGEWWGQGIQRRYGLTEKRFSLFNSARWGAHNPNTPDCCGVVPVLYHGPFDVARINGAVSALMMTGSVAAPGFMKPEGVVVYHEASGGNFKILCENDHQPKG